VAGLSGPCRVLGMLYTRTLGANGGILVGVSGDGCLQDKPVEGGVTTQVIILLTDNAQIGRY